MMSKLFALVLVCIMTSAAMAQEAKVTSLMSKELKENPGKEVLMIMSSIHPVPRTRSTDTMRRRLFTSSRAPL